MIRIVLLFLVATLVAFAGCSEKYSPIFPEGDTDTLIIIVPSDTVFTPCDTCPPDTVFIDTCDACECDTLPPDTVYIDRPTTICGQIRASQKSLEIPLVNESGGYLLQVHMTADKPKPQQTVDLTVDGILVESVEALADTSFEVKTSLKKNAILVFKPNIPPASGHAIHICVTITAL